jgi:hypothetical protein
VHGSVALQRGDGGREFFILAAPAFGSATTMTVLPGPGIDLDQCHACMKMPL